MINYYHNVKLSIKIINNKYIRYIYKYTDIITSGLIILINRKLIEYKDLKSYGVLWYPIKIGLLKSPELIFEYIINKKVYFHTFTLNGSFLYVPKGITINSPLACYYYFTNSSQMDYLNTIIVCQDYTNISYINTYSNIEKKPAFVIANSTILCGIEANIELLLIQNISKLLLFKEIIANKSSNILLTTVNLGGRTTRSYNYVSLSGIGANVNLYSLIIACKHQEYNQNTYQIHEVSYTRSNILYKNVLKDKSRTIFNGLIKIAPNTIQTNAYQINKNLILSGNAESNSIPGLEIFSNDTKCTHGATITWLSSKDIFYINSRGIPKHLAKRLLILGFISDNICRPDFTKSINKLVKYYFI